MGASTYVSYLLENTVVSRMKYLQYSITFFCLPSLPAAVYLIITTYVRSVLRFPLPSSVQIAGTCTPGYYYA